MTFGKLPFDNDDNTELFENILSQQFTWPDNRQISEGLKDLISRMLDKSPRTRITIDEMKHNDWLNEGYTVSLAAQGADILANLSNQELATQGVSA